jgi:hypothetical protein
MLPTRQQARAWRRQRRQHVACRGCCRCRVRVCGWLAACLLCCALQQLAAPQPARRPLQRQRQGLSLCCVLLLAPQAHGGRSQSGASCCLCCLLLPGWPPRRLPQHDAEAWQTLPRQRMRARVWARLVCLRHVPAPAALVRPPAAGQPQPRALRPARQLLLLQLRPGAAAALGQQVMQQHRRQLPLAWRWCRWQACWPRRQATVGCRSAGWRRQARGCRAPHRVRCCCCRPCRRRRRPGDCCRRSAGCRVARCARARGWRCGCQLSPCSSPS